MAEGKPLPHDWISKLQLKPSKSGFREGEIQIVGHQGTRFCILLRQSEHDPLSFSALLFVSEANSVRRFRLRRYNGRNHGHRNKLDGTRLSVGFHIHQATERYQLAGFDEDAFATTTDRYSNLSEAVECLIADCGCRDSRRDKGLF